MLPRIPKDHCPAVFMPSLPNPLLPGRLYAEIAMYWIGGTDTLLKHLHLASCQCILAQITSRGVVLLYPQLAAVQAFLQHPAEL